MTGPAITQLEEDVVDKGVPFRMRFALTLVAALAMAAFAAPMALAQSPDDIPGFDQLPIPGGDTPTEDPEPGEGDGGTGATETPQVDAPGGGVDTGAGGLATGEGALPLGAAAALAATGGAVLVARRRAAQR
jgi:hypothetical protein